MQITRLQPKKWQALSNGVLYSHYSDVDYNAFRKRWPNFKPSEFACRRTGRFYYHPPTFDCVQRSRTDIRRAIYINSGHRSRLHNALVGGEPNSAHLLIALDISTTGHNRAALLRVLIRSGFKSFGFYEKFIHVDLRPGRRWFGSPAAREIWQPILLSLNADVMTQRRAAAA